VRASIGSSCPLFKPWLTFDKSLKVFQRLAVAVSCLFFYILTIRTPPGPGGDVGMLALLSALACIEKLCSIMNMVSVEKDWVPRFQRQSCLA